MVGVSSHWKPKGGYSFLMPVNSDYLMYADESEIVSAITKVVEKQNTMSCKFEYREYEIQWSKPTIRFHTHDTPNLQDIVFCFPPLVMAIPVSDSSAYIGSPELTGIKKGIPTFGVSMWNFTGHWRPHYSFRNTDNLPIGWLSYTII